MLRLFGNRPGRNAGDRITKDALSHPISGLPAWVIKNLLLIFAMVCPISCASAPTVDLTPTRTRQRMHINFTRAYFAPSESGEDQIILLSDPIDQSARTTDNGALVPYTAPPLWQALSIRLHWRTNSSPKTDALVASNAVLHWYVYGKPTATGVGVLHYLGTGTVTVSTDSTGAEVTVTHADLKMSDIHGDIRDPFGQFQINTTFHAETSPTHVQQSLDDIAKAVSDADHK
jgi:hypothetical protein